MKPFWLIIPLFLIAIGCSDVVNFTQKDVDNQPWLADFTKGFAIMDGKHDISNGVVKIDLSTQSCSLYFQHADSIAASKNWRECYSSTSSRIYLKNIPFQDGEEDIVVIKAICIKEGMVSLKVY